MPISLARRLQFVAVLTAMAGLFAATTAPAAEYDFRFGPKKAGRKATFTASFTAPFAANDNSTFYEFEAFGPPKCAAADTFSFDPVTVGQRVVLRLRRSDVTLPTEGVRRWCRGAYIANVYYQSPGSQPNVLIGNVRFRIR
jgi:hypothetical protein